MSPPTSPSAGGVVTSPPGEPPRAAGDAGDLLDLALSLVGPRPATSGPGRSRCQVETLRLGSGDAPWSPDRLCAVTVVRGTVSLEPDDGGPPLGPYTGPVLVRPGAGGSRFVPGPAGAVAVVVALPPATVLDVGAAIGSRPAADLPTLSTHRVGPAPALTEVVARALRTCSSPADRDVLLAGTILELVYRLLRSPAGGWLAAAARRQEREDPVAVADRFVRENLDRPIAVSDVARACGIGVRTLRRVLRDELDLTPSRFVRNVRLDRARALLDEGRPVGEVAAAVGYLSSSHFVSGFRERYGHPPRAHLDAVRAGGIGRAC